MQIEYLDHLPSEFRASAVTLFLNTFHKKLLPILGDSINTQEALEKGLDPTHCFVAICENRLVGILGIQTRKGSFLNPNLKIFIKAYGILGGLFKLIGLAVLHHSTAPDELYVDGICVIEDMRNKGIGSRLFELMESYALNNNKRFISLEVVDTNTKAKKLYQRVGFVETTRQNLWPFYLIYRLPFKISIQMRKVLS